MSAEESVKTAQAGYAAFGRGDLPAILELLTDDIEWIEPGPADVIPTAGTYRGKEEVAGFFAALGGNLEVHKFEPHKFIAQDDDVVVLISTEATVRRPATRSPITSHTSGPSTVASSRRSRPSGIPRRPPLPTAEDRWPTMVSARTVASAIVRDPDEHRIELTRRPSRRRPPGARTSPRDPR